MAFQSVGGFGAGSGARVPASGRKFGETVVEIKFPFPEKKSSQVASATLELFFDKNAYFCGMKSSEEIIIATGKCPGRDKSNNLLLKFCPSFCKNTKSH